MSIKTKIKNKKIIAGTIIIVAALAFFGWQHFIKSDSQSQNPAPTTEPYINYGPTTDVEKKETEDHKKQLSEDSGSTGSSASKKTVTPMITAYGYTSSEGLQVGARVPSVIEDSGTCTLVATNSGKTVQQSKSATANASDTSCGFIRISSDRLSKGVWTATVAYSSTKSEGISESVKITVN